MDEHRESDLNGILASISDAFMALDTDLVVTYFNRAAEEHLGRTREEVLGKPLFEAFPEARGSIFEERYRRAIETGEPDLFEVHFDVEPYQNWYDVRVYPTSTGISIFFQVTTDRKASESRFRNLFENSLAPIVIADDQGQYLDVNAAGPGVPGRSRQSQARQTVQTGGCDRAHITAIGSIKGERRLIERTDVTDLP